MGGGEVSGDRLAEIVYEFEQGGNLETRDVLALVEIAEAAREAAKLLGAGYDNDTFDDRAFVVLRDALARLDGGAAEEDA